MQLVLARGEAQLIVSLEDYLAEGLSSLAAALEHVSNTTPPIANVAFASSLLAKDLGNALEEQTENIVKKLK